MLKKYIASVLLALQIILLSACSFSSEDKEPKHPLLKISSYSTEVNGVSVHLSLHPLDGMEDILQADVMIHQVDGSGPSFEVQNASLEENDGLLSFDWTDGFGNEGTAELKMPEVTSENIGSAVKTSVAGAKDTSNPSTTNSTNEKDPKVKLILRVDEVVNERDMMFIKEYELTPTGDNQASQSKPSTEEGSSDVNGN